MCASVEQISDVDREELKYFYGKIPTGYSVAWALCPTDIWCTFLSLCAQNAGSGFIKSRKIKLITIKDNIGCGKSTQIDILSKELEHRSDVVIIPEPVKEKKGC